MLAAHAFAALLAACAPNVAPLTMTALVAQESGFAPFAIDDVSRRRAYFPSDRSAAERLASELLAAGDRIDVGYGQIDSENFAALGLDLRMALDPCTNLHAGAALLAADYARAARRFGPGQVALAHALSAYHAGDGWSGLDYARALYARGNALRRTAGER
ncbi:MAG: transglycosylase SLT domain-containing protein [Vulcanimicrobiaceae bacterium]